MAFSQINLDAPGTPPGRNDPCPCGSGKKTKRCCGVDRCRFLPLRGRHRGVVPVDLAERVDQIAGEFTVRFLARTFLPARLGGLSPAALSNEERGELRELFWRAVRAGRAGARDPRAGRLRPTARPAASFRTRLRAAARRASGRACGQAPAGFGEAAADLGGHAPSRPQRRPGHLRQSCRARRRSAPGISGSSRPRAGCGTRATPPPARTRRRPPVSLRS